VAEILAGGRAKAVRERGHDRLPVWGTLRRLDRPTIVSFIDQLVGQGLLRKERGKYPTLSLTRTAAEVLRRERSVGLTEPANSRRKPAAVGRGAADDQGLFDALRARRREIAEERDVPAFVVFSDATLRDMAAVRPASLDELLTVKGVGEAKAADFGVRFLEAIQQYTPVRRSDTPRERSSFALFASGASIDEAAAKLGLARSTVAQHLSDYIAQHRPADIDRWVDPDTYARVSQAGSKVGWDLLKPIYERLDGSVDYESIRAVRSHVLARRKTGSDSE
jgi:ATP-dependent DNA helicase RecQ